MNVDRFIILTHGRAGSTYLQHLLDSHPSIACYEELFNVSNKSENSFYAFCQHRYPKLSYFFLRETISRSRLNFPLAFLFREYLKQLYIREQKKKIGFRLIYNQLLYYNPLVDWVTRNSIPIIHLQRANLLKATISLIKAQETGVYTSTSRSLAKGQKISVSPTRILDELNNLSKEKLQCQFLTRDNPTLTLSYEVFFENQSSALQQIMDFVGIANPLFQVPDIIKTNPERISDFLENYEEVKKALSGTCWEKYLD